MVRCGGPSRRLGRLGPRTDCRPCVDRRRGDGGRERLRGLVQVRTPPLRRWRRRDNQRECPSTPLEQRSRDSSIARYENCCRRARGGADDESMGSAGSSFCSTKMQGARLLSPRRRLSTPAQMRCRSRAFLLETTAGKRSCSCLVMSGVSARPRVPSAQITMRADLSLREYLPVPFRCLCGASWFRVSQTPTFPDQNVFVSLKEEE